MEVSSIHLDSTPAAEALNASAEIASAFGDSSYNYGRTANLLKAVENSEDHIILTVRNSVSNFPIATGYATKSIHEYNHWGISLLGVRAGHEHSPETTQLVEALIRHTEVTQQRMIIDPNVSTTEPVRRYDTPFHGISTGTRYPELFEPFGFHRIHEHTGGHGQTVTWLLRALGGAVEYFDIGFAQPTVLPKAYAHVRPLSTAQDIEGGAAVIAEEWGAESALEFYRELPVIKGMPGSEFFGIHDGHRICGVGAVIKSLHHEEAWARSWIVVLKSHRGQGHAQQLIQGMLAHADLQHPQFSDGPMVMEGFTYIPDYYRKYGNIPTARFTEMRPRGFPTFTARITPHPRDVDLSQETI